MVTAKIKTMANAKYNESGYGKAKKVIDEMPAEQVKEYLKKMIEDNFVVGLEIIKKQKVIRRIKHMNLDDTKKRVQKYLNSNKRYPLIVDVQTREDLANIAEYFKVGSNKFPAIEEFCNQDEAIKLDELYASVSSNSGNTFITGLSGFLMLFGENVAKQALKTLITTSISGHVVIITYQCEKYLRFTDPRISESEIGYR